MIEIGRICVKLAGRDAGQKCVIVNMLDDNYVLIDGGVRRRKCNIAHVEPTSQVIKINKDASHDVVKKEFEKLKFSVWETKPKEQKEKPTKQRKVKEKPEKVSKKKEKKAGKEQKTEKKEKESKKPAVKK